MHCKISLQRAAVVAAAKHVMEMMIKTLKLMEVRRFSDAAINQLYVHISNTAPAGRHDSTMLYGNECD